MVVTDEMVATMKRGSVVVDIAIDQGGCIETSHETTHADPVYEQHGVLHYAVGNMPGAVPNTSTYALTNVTLPYLAELARLGVAEAAQADPPSASESTPPRGHVVNSAVAEALGRPTSSWVRCWGLSCMSSGRRSSSTTSTRRSSASCSSTGACPTPAWVRRSACRRRPSPAGAAPHRERRHAGGGVTDPLTLGFGLQAMVGV